VVIFSITRPGPGKLGNCVPTVSVELIPVFVSRLCLLGVWLHAFECRRLAASREEEAGL